MSFVPSAKPFEELALTDTESLREFDLVARFTVVPSLVSKLMETFGVPPVHAPLA